MILYICLFLFMIIFIGVLGNFILFFKTHKYIENISGVIQKEFVYMAKSYAQLSKRNLSFYWTSWIDADGEQPPDMEEILFLVGTRKIKKGFYNKEDELFYEEEETYQWNRKFLLEDRVTYWCPIPHIPKNFIVRESEEVDND